MFSLIEDSYIVLFRKGIFEVKYRFRIKSTAYFVAVVAF